MLTALALFEIVALLWPGHLTDHFHTLRAGLRIGFIWAIALADWITKRGWLKRHSEVRDFLVANTVFVLALFALYCWASGALMEDAPDLASAPVLLVEFSLKT